MAVLPFRVVGLRVTQATDAGLPSSAGTRCVNIEWEASNADLFAEEWCAEAPCLRTRVLVNDEPGEAATYDAACWTSGAAVECLMDGLSSVRIQVCWISSWAPIMRCVTSPAVHLSVDSLSGVLLVDTQLSISNGFVPVAPSCKRYYHWQ